MTTNSTTNGTTRESMKHETLTCDERSALTVDALGGTLPAERAAAFHDHLGACATCRTEMAELDAVWSALGELPEEAPSPELGERFRTFLAAYEAGLAARRPSLGERLTIFFDRLIEHAWPRRPAFQLAAAAAALVVGMAAGLLLGSGSDADVGALETELASLRQTVSLALLAQDSASARLEGVSVGRRAADELSRHRLGDDALVTALVRVVRVDPSDNVRLAAIDALMRVADRRAVAETLTEILAAERSPLIQLALVDLLLLRGGERGRAAVETLLVRDDLDATVRGYVAEHLGPNV